MSEWALLTEMMAVIERIEQKLDKIIEAISILSELEGIIWRLTH